MKPDRAARDMNISVIVPVFGEAKTINAFLEIVQMVFPAPAHEIIVVDGGPKGDSLAAVALPQVKKIRSGRGRARQMNQGAAMAKGNILLFLHADTFLPEDAPELIANLLSEDPDLVGGAFSLGIDDDRIPSEKIVRCIHYLARAYHLHRPALRRCNIQP